MRKIFFLAVLVGVASMAQADCFDDAAAYHKINPWILRAIAFQESSFRPGVVSQNTDQSIDVGTTGTNSVHFPELKKYGVSPNDLLDPCKSVYVGAWLYSKKVKKYGNTWLAVGAYHSENIKNRDIYISRIQLIISRWSEQGMF
jgi:soluble lytic murein transglycosylase-like protein